MAALRPWQAPGLRPRPVPNAEADFASALAAVRARVPESEALVGSEQRFTYRQLQGAVEAAAGVLAELGVGPGDRIGTLARVRPEVMIAFLACMRVGGVWVGLNPALAPNELEAQISDCGLSTLIVEQALVDRLDAVLRPLTLQTVLLDGAGPDGWAALLERRSNVPAPPIAAVDPLTPAAIAYTSGTTGLPKGVVHSVHNMMAAAVSRRDGVQADEGPTDIRRGAAMGLTNLNALVRSGLTALVSGGCLVCIPRRDAAGIAEWIRLEAIQTISLPAAVLHDLLDDSIHPDALASVQFVGNAGSPVTEAVRLRYEAKFGHPVLVGYGQTEALTVLTASGLDRPNPEGGSGRPCGHIEVATFRADGTRATAGEVGEIRARARGDGPWTDVWRPMLGYWRRLGDAEPALAGGWLHTGDLGRFGDNGELYVTGRLKDLIVRGGANIYAAEVERVVKADVRVRDVAVIGRPDPRLGETVAAVVELARGISPSAELEAELDGQVARQLARYKRPEAWAFVAELPRTASGKVVKRGLAEAHFSRVDGEPRAPSAGTE